MYLVATVPMDVWNHPDGQARYAPSDCSFTKVLMPLMVNKRVELIPLVRWASCLITDVIQYRPYLWPYRHAYLHNWVSIQNGCFFR